MRTSGKILATPLNRVDNTVPGDIMTVRKSPQGEGVALKAKLIVSLLGKNCLN